MRGGFVGWGYRGFLGCLDYIHTGATSRQDGHIHPPTLSGDDDEGAAILAYTCTIPNESGDKLR
jgi:hypothetical protein